MRTFANAVTSSALGLCLGVAFTSLIATGMIGCGGGTGTVVGKTLTTPTITTDPTASAITYGAALSTSTLTPCTASVAGHCAWTTPSTVPAVGTDSESVTFEPSDTTDYSSLDFTVEIVVNAKVLITPTITTDPTASAITYGAALSTSTLTPCTASVAGHCAWTDPSTVPAVGTDSEGVTFTPSDTTDYTTATTNVQIVVNPVTPMITGISPEYVVADAFTTAEVNYTVDCEGCESGDILNSPTFGSVTLPSTETSIGVSIRIAQQGTFEPQFIGERAEYPGGTYGNERNTVFLGPASESTLAVSATTGTEYQVEQATGQVYSLTSSGTTGNLGIASTVVSNIAVDDITGKVAYAFGDGSDIAVLSQDGSRCDISPGMSNISSVAARGEYLTVTDPVDNLVGIAKMDCTGYKTVSVAGQPWSVAMTNNGTEVDAYVLSRDKCVNEHPAVNKLGVPSGTVEGTVELSGISPVSTIRASNANAGVYQLAVFNNLSIAAVLSMSTKTDGTVSLLGTDTSSTGGVAKPMAVTATIPILDASTGTAEMPTGIAVQETSSTSTLWVGSFDPTTGEPIINLGTIDPTTEVYTSGVGACPTDMVDIAVASTGVICSQGSTIVPAVLNE